MKTCLPPLLVAVVLSLGFLRAGAQAAPVATPEDPAHQELRAIRDALVTAFNNRDYDGFLRHLHPNVVATWQNAEVARRHDGIKAFMKKMSEGESKQVESAQAKVEVDELASLYQNSCVAFGSLAQDFKFFDGREIPLKSRWTATFIKEDGRWLLAAIHISANIFDNPILGLAVRKTALWTGVGAVVLGGLGGWLIGRRRRAKA
jgi:ketosteroid isomerase-like protein